MVVLLKHQASSSGAGGERVAERGWCGSCVAGRQGASSAAGGVGAAGRAGGARARGAQARSCRARRGAWHERVTRGPKQLMDALAH